MDVRYWIGRTGDLRYCRVARRNIFFWLRRLLCPRTYSTVQLAYVVLRMAVANYHYLTGKQVPHNFEYYSRCKSRT
jgi:hypothetical protein